MQKKVYRFASYLLVLFLLPLFTTFLFACSKKAETPPIDNSTPVTPTPDKPTTEIPDSPVFDDIVQYVKDNGKLQTDYFLTISTGKNNIYPNLRKTCYLSYNTTGKSLDYANLYLSNTNSTTKNNETFGFILKIPNIENYTTHNFAFTYLKYKLLDNSIASAKLTIPATIYDNEPTTLTLPELQNFTTSGQDTMKDLSAFRSILVEDINNAFANLNTYFVEKIKNGDNRYNNAIFKYFSLPVMLQV